MNPQTDFHPSSFWTTTTSLILVCFSLWFDTIISSPNTILLVLLKKNPQRAENRRQIHNLCVLLQNYQKEMIKHTLEGWTLQKYIITFSIPSQISIPHNFMSLDMGWIQVLWQTHVFFWTISILASFGLPKSPIQSSSTKMPLVILNKQNWDLAIRGRLYNC